MTAHIEQAYAVDIDFRINGFEKANPEGYKVNVHEIGEGVIYRDELVTVTALRVSHGTLESYAYRFDTPDRSILISGDTCPMPVIAAQTGCDILLHEVEYAGGLSQRTPQWQKYHRAVHTLSTDLAQIAKAAQPGLLVTYHRIYHLDVFAPGQDTRAEVARREAAILEEIRSAGYEGPVVNGHDLDIY